MTTRNVSSPPVISTEAAVRVAAIASTKPQVAAAQRVVALAA